MPRNATVRATRHAKHATLHDIALYATPRYTTFYATVPHAARQAPTAAAASAAHQATPGYVTLHATQRCTPRDSTRYAAVHATPRCTLHHAARYTPLHARRSCTPRHTARCMMLHTTPLATRYATRHTFGHAARKTTLRATPHCTLHTALRAALGTPNCTPRHATWHARTRARYATRFAAFHPAAGPCRDTRNHAASHPRCELPTQKCIKPLAINNNFQDFLIPDHLISAHCPPPNAQTKPLPNLFTHPPPFLDLPRHGLLPTQLPSPIKTTKLLSPTALSI